MGDDEWTIGLKAETARRVLDIADLQTNAFCTVVVQPVEVDEDDYAGDFTAFLQAACFTGRFMSVADGGLTIGGDGLLDWLGDSQDGGEMYTGATTPSSSFTMEEQLNARIFTSRANNLTLGTCGATGPRVISVEPGTTSREFLDTIVALYSTSSKQWEYRVNTDGSVDVERAGALWPTASAPTAILSRRGGYGKAPTTDKYLALDGVGDASTPDSVPTSITGDITCFAKVRLDDYSGAAVQTIVSKWDTTGNQRSYRFELTTAGEMQTFLSNNGTATLSDTSTGAPPLTNGTDYWLAWGVDVSAGGNKVFRYYYSPGTDFLGRQINDWRDVDSDSWNLWDTNTVATTTSIFNGTAPTRVGGIVGDTLMPTGRVYAVEVLDNDYFNGGTDTQVADPHFNEWPVGDTSEDDNVGNTWTLSGNATITYAPGSTLTGLPAILDKADLDVYDYRTSVYVGDPDTAIIGNASQTPPTGWTAFMTAAAPVIRSFVSSSPRVAFRDRPRRWSVRIGASRYVAWTLSTAGQATNMATAVLAKTDTYDFTVTADVDAFAVSRFVDVGDTLYVWDQRQRLLDLNNEVHYRGEPAHPKKLRLRRLTVPIQRGNGVYLITGGGTTINNITRSVAFEDGPAHLELGTRGYLHKPNARPARLNRRRIARGARSRYLIGRWLGQSPS
jgi:hypothetical protein